MGNQGETNLFYPILKDVRPARFKETKVVIAFL